MRRSSRRKPRDAQQPAAPGRRRFPASAAAVALLLAAALAVFGRTVGFQFVNYDDDQYVYRNPHVLAGLTGETVAWAFTNTEASGWFPLTWLSLMVDAHWFGPRAGRLDPAWLASAMHAVNLALHAANTLLLFAAFRGMTGAVWRSAAVAALFALHPLHVEAVAWVTARKDLLSTLLGFAALAAYAWYARRPGVLRYLAVAAALALGLLAKPMLVTWPLLLLLLDYWPLGRSGREKGTGTVCRNGPSGALHERCLSPFPAQPMSLWRLVLEKVPLLAIVAASVLATLFTFRQAIVPLEDAPLGQRLSNIPLAYVTYLGQTFWPVGLTVHPLDSGAAAAAGGSWAAAGAAALLAVVTAATLWGAWRGRRYLAVGWLWFLGTLLPVIGLVRFGVQATADRFTYVPLVGLFIMMVWGAAEIAAAWRRARVLVAAAGILVLVVLATAAWRQTAHWRNSEALWTRALACNPPTVLAYNNLGLAFFDQGEFQRAADQFRNALELDARSTMARVNLGNALIEQGKYPLAIAQYEEVLKYDPDSSSAYNNLGYALSRQGKLAEAEARCRKALELDPALASAHNNLGGVLARQGRVDAAVSHFEQALRSDPLMALAHYHLGLARVQQGKPAAAVAHFQAALEINPRHAESRSSLALALKDTGRPEEALAQFREGLRRCPNDVGLLNNAAWMLATSPRVSLRNGPEAVELARRAVELSGGRAVEMLDTLGAAYAEAGRFPEAITAAQRAAAIAARTDQALAAAIGQRLRLYRQGVAFRDAR